PIAGDVLVWIGPASGDWTVAANWLDTTANTHHVPGSGDIVTLDGNVTVTISNATQSALSIDVAPGSTLALNRATLTLGQNASVVDGTLTVDSSTLRLGGSLTVNGTTNWLNTTGVVLIDLNTHTLTNNGTLLVGGPGSSDVRLQAENGFL